MLHLKKWVALVFLLLVSIVFLVVNVNPTTDPGCYSKTTVATCSALSGCAWDSIYNNCFFASCWNQPDQSTCINFATQNNASCTWNSNYNYCEELTCYSFDKTNQTRCETDTLSLYNLSCRWSNGSGQEWCDPTTQQGCSSYNGNELDCIDTYYCVYNKTSTICIEPLGGGATLDQFNPDCGVISAELVCRNISGCTWNAANLITSCSGSPTPNGIQCGNITNKSICNTMTLLSTCCTYNSTGNCTVAASNNCWQNMQPLPIGATYCSDYAAIKSKSMCENISGSPWYMGCKWDNKSTSITSDDECSIQGYGWGGTNFYNVNSQTSCESTGGVWNTETYYDQNGSLGQWTWCESSFGAGSQSCNNSCWACEYKADGSAHASQSAGEKECLGSALTNCKWSNDTNAPNKLGWCEVSWFSGGVGGFFGGYSFGGGNCEQNCFDCFINSSCSTSNASCTWSTDQYGSDWNKDGQVDGWCGSTKLYNMNNCDLNVQACWNETQCIQSTASGGAYWNTTYYMCLNNGTIGSKVEICFLYGDEDGDGNTDCSDADCQNSTSCGYGFGGYGMGGGAGFGTEGTAFGNGVFIEPWICMQHDGNSSNCVAQNGSGLQANDSVCVYGKGPAGNWCDPKFNNFMGGDAIKAMPEPLEFDDKGDASSAWLDIWFVGVHDLGDTLSIGIMVNNTTNFAGCTKAFGTSTLSNVTGTGAVVNQTGKYYRYLDVDNNASTGCDAINSSGANINGFEYKYKYIATNNGGILNETVKPIEKCIGNSSGSKFWAGHTTAQAPSVVKEMCTIVDPFQGFVGAQGLTIKKSDIGNPVGNIRIMIVTASNATNETLNPVDSAGPFIFTPGSVDFAFENCFGFVDMDGDGLDPSSDPDCTSMKKLGYVLFEDCWNGFDDNNDGFADCADSMCKYDPFACGGTYGWNGSKFNIDLNDQTPPSVSMQVVDTFPDSVLIFINSYEPSNATIKFYAKDNNCTTLNQTINDKSLNDTILSNDFKPWHDIGINHYSSNKQNISFKLAANTTYYYKYKLCDGSNNCLNSKCSNFTTVSNYDSDSCPKCVFTVGDMDYINTADDATALGNLQIEYDYNQDGTYDDKIPSKGTANQTNFTQTESLNIKFHNPNVSGGDNWSLVLINVSFAGTPDINLTNSFVYNETSNSTGTDTWFGMDGDKWDEMMQELKPKLVQITIPENGSDLYHCPENNMNNCTNVSKYATKLGSTNVNATLNFSTWQFDPTLIGFSSFGSGSSGGSAGSSGSSSSSSAGGGGSSAPAEAVFAGVVGPSFIDVSLTESGKKVVYKFNVLEGVLKLDNLPATMGKHEIKFMEKDVTAKTAKFMVTSDPQEVALKVGETKKLDLNENGFDDLSLKLNDVTIGSVMLELEVLPDTGAEALEEALKGAEEEALEEVTGAAGEVPEEAAAAKKFNATLLVAALVVLALVAYVVVYVVYKKKSNAPKK